MYYRDTSKYKINNVKKVLNQSLHLYSKHSFTYKIVSLISYRYLCLSHSHFILRYVWVADKNAKHTWSCNILRCTNLLNNVFPSRSAGPATRRAYWSQYVRRALSTRYVNLTLWIHCFKQYNISTKHLARHARN